MVGKHRRYSSRFWDPLFDSLVLIPLALALSLLEMNSHGHSYIVFTAALFVEVLKFVYVIVMHVIYGGGVGKLICRVEVLDYSMEQRIPWKQAIVREAIPMVLLLVAIILSLVDKTGILSETGTVAQFFQSTLFGIFKLSAFILVIWYVIEVVTMLLDSKNRALHDHLAGTIVVRSDVPIWHCDR